MTMGCYIGAVVAFVAIGTVLLLWSLPLDEE